MSGRIRFHCDEHIDPAIVGGLRRRKIDVTTSIEAGLLGATDKQHMEFARAQGRLIITKDIDFLRLSAQGEAHYGIAYCKQGQRSVGQLLVSLIHIYEELTPEDVTGRVIYL